MTMHRLGFYPFAAAALTFPVVASTTQSIESSNVTTINITLPATINAGDLLLATVMVGGDRSCFWPVGWSVLQTNLHGYSCAYRIADGTEDGTIIDVDMLGGGGARIVAQVQRITGAAADFIPEYVAGNVGIPTNTANPNPAAVTPSWGSNQNLFFVNCGVSAGDTVSVYPGSYTHHQNDVTDGGNNVRLVTCSRQLAASTDDPSAFTFSSANPKSFGTIAIAPTGLPPTAAARIAGSMTSLSLTNTTNHVVLLPLNIVAGDLVIIAMTLAAGTTFTMPAGWTTLENNIGASIGTGLIYRECDGSEGASITVTSVGSVQIQSVALKIKGHASGVAPEKGTLVAATTANPNPPAVTPSWGSMDNLFIVINNRANQTLPTVWPTNYTRMNLTLHNIGISRGLQVTARNVVASTDDPGTFTFGASASCQTQTIVIKPA